MKSAVRAPLLFLFCCAAIFLLMDRTIAHYDEGIVLTGAMRVLAGDVIHRDFYANYGPGQFYAVAGLFQVFGHGIVVERWWDVAVRSGIAVLVFLLLVPRVRPWLAWAAALLSAAWLASTGHPSYPVYPSLLCSLAATWFMARALDAGSSRDAVFAGACVAATTLFRYDVGFFALVALVVGSVAWERAGKAREEGPLLSPAVLRLVGTAAAAVLALLLLYAAIGALPDFLHDVVFFPSDQYARTRSLPFPPFTRLWNASYFSLLGIYLPIGAGAIALAVLALGVQGNDPAKASARALAFLLVPLVALFYLKGIVRVSIEHMQLALLPSIALLALSWELAAQRAVRVVVGALCMLNVAVAGMSLHDRSQTENIVALQVPKLGLGVVAQPMRFNGDEREAAVRYLAQHAAPGERVFIGLARHDKILINDVAAYFLSGHLPATKWHHFDPGLQTAAFTQAAMVKELHARKPRYAWVESTWDGAAEPNESARSSGVHLLDNYLLWAYEPVQRFGTILILQRKDTAG